MPISVRILYTFKYHKRKHCATFVCVKPLKSSVGFSVRTISRCGEFVYKREVKSLIQLGSCTEINENLHARVTLVLRPNERENLKLYGNTHLARNLCMTLSANFP